MTEGSRIYNIVKKPCSVKKCEEESKYTPIITVPDPRFKTIPQVVDFFLSTVSVCEKHKRILNVNACMHSVLWEYIKAQCGERGFEPNFDSLRLEFATDSGVRVV